MKYIITIFITLFISFTSASAQDIITVSADNTTIMRDGEEPNTWWHAPLLTIINVKDRQVHIQDVETRKFSTQKILDFAYRNEGEIGFLCEYCFIAINTITKEMQRMVTEDTTLISKDVEIEGL